MKALILTAALSSMIAATPVFAADAQSTVGTASSPVSVQTAAVTTDASTQSMHAVAPQGKSRAEVFDELVRAEKSGEMQLLNSTLYAN